MKQITAILVASSCLHLLAAKASPIVENPPSQSSPADRTNGAIPGLTGGSSNSVRPSINCSDISTGRAAKCWDELNLTQYVSKWMYGAVCNKGEGFSECYLRQNGFPSLDCSRISVSSCPAPQSVGQLSAQQWYVVYNIYAINAFFNSWWTLVGSSAGIGADNVEQIAQLLEQPSEVQVNIGSIINSLSATLLSAPISWSSISNPSGPSYQWKAISQTLQDVIASDPSIADFLVSSDPGTQTTRVSDLPNYFPTILSQVQSNVNQTLVSAMANVTQFLTFAKTGNFSSNVPSFPDQANHLYYFFNTYIISALLISQNVAGVIGKGANIQEIVAQNSSNLAYPIPGCQKYNDQGICDAWWYSEGYESSFALNNFNFKNQSKNYGPILNILFSNLTTGPLLFEAPYACAGTGDGKSKSEVNVVSRNLNCISPLKILTWDTTCTLSRQGASKCEFLEAPSQDGFLGPCKDYEGKGRGHCFKVPYSYLGPLLTQPDISLQRT